MPLVLIAKTTPTTAERHLWTTRADPRVDPLRSSQLPHIRNPNTSSVVNLRVDSLQKRSCSLDTNIIIHERFGTLGTGLTWPKPRRKLNSRDGYNRLTQGTIGQTGGFGVSCSLEQRGQV